jgi:serine/threonine protein kinase
MNKLLIHAVEEFKIVLDAFFQGYEISEALGKGGFATVYKARFHGSNQDVAIKMVKLLRQQQKKR